MAANTLPINPKVPFAVALSLAAVTACTTRAPTATASLAGANIVQLCDVSSEGRRIDRIQVQACSSAITAATVPMSVLIWEWDGTTAWVIDEIPVTAVTPSTTTAAFVYSKTYSTLVLPPAHKLFASVTVTTTASTNALSVIVYGGDY